MRFTIWRTTISPPFLHTTFYQSICPNLHINSSYTMDDNRNHGCLGSESRMIVDMLQSDGEKLARNGEYREALGKWEAALTLMPENAVLYIQKAQLLLELGSGWQALKAATRATELDPSWNQAWITLRRAQLNTGCTDALDKSFEIAFGIKHGNEESKKDRETGSHLVKRRKYIHSAGF